MASERDSDRQIVDEVLREVFADGAWTGEVPARPISSVELLRFVVRLEARFALEIPDAELRPENFTSRETVLGTLARLSGREQATPSEESSAVRDAVLAAVRAAKDGADVAVLDDEDVFDKFGLNSLEIFGVLVQLEKEFAIVIGEEAGEFDRIRTFLGLQQLVAEKARAGAPARGVGA